MDKLPSNLLDEDAQVELREKIISSFSSPNNTTQASASKTMMGHSRARSTVTSFDVHTHGFDLPASNALSRVSKKLDRFVAFQDNYGEVMTKRDLFHRSVMKKHKDREMAVLKYQDKMSKEREEKWKERWNTHTERLNNIKKEKRLNDREI